MDSLSVLVHAIERQRSLVHSLRINVGQAPARCEVLAGMGDIWERERPWIFTELTA